MLLIASRSRGIVGPVRRSAPLRTPARWLPLLLLCALSACGGGGSHPVSSNAGRGNYTPPGPPDDPWGPYIKQASNRFSVPEAWPRAVMHQESGGHQYIHGQPTTSDAGAMGLMQVMPATYAELAARYGLGSDPYEPHDNIMAGTGYIRELYDRYGSPAFLAAYNAGPHRLDAYLAGNGNLPNETVNYLASTAPNLGRQIAMTGPLASFGEGGGAAAPVLHDFVRTPAGCWQDPDAAYDPDAPCRTAPPIRIARAASQSYSVASYSQPPVRPAPRVQLAAVTPPANCWRDPDAAYDPAAPCRPAPQPIIQMASAVPPPVPWGQSAPISSAPPAPPMEVASAPEAPRHTFSARCWQNPDAAYDPTAPCRNAPPARDILPARTTQYASASGWGQGPAGAAPPRTRFASNFLIPSAAAATIRPAMATGRWAIQVGAFANPDQARRAAESVRTLAPRELGATRAVLGTTAPFGGQVLYRARLLGLSAQTAAEACGSLQAKSQACITVPPGN